MMVCKNDYLILKRILPDKKIGTFEIPEEMEDGGIIWYGTVVASSHEEYPVGADLLFSRYLPQEFTTSDQEKLLVLKASDVVAVLSKG